MEYNMVMNKQSPGKDQDYAQTDRINKNAFQPSEQPRRLSARDRKRYAKVQEMRELTGRFGSHAVPVGSAADMELEGRRTV